jgi:hypothetical protein
LLKSTCFSCALKTNDDTLSILDGLPVAKKSLVPEQSIFFKTKPGNVHGMLNFGCNAEVFKEALVRRPKLAPHGFFHALLGVNQLGSILELAHGLHPLAKTCQMDAAILKQEFVLTNLTDAS